jgi:polyhydroxyalkanoate synthesis regulator phasin
MRVFLIIISFIVSLCSLNSAYAYVESIHISIAPEAIEFHLENPNGLITGYTPNGVQEFIPEIPHYYEKGVYSYDSVPDLYNYDYFHVIETGFLPRQLTGKYRIVIYGIKTPFVTNIHLSFGWSEDHSWNAKYSNSLLIYPNAVWTYEFDFPVTVPANGQIVLIKVAQPSDLIKDLTTAGQLGYIGNKQFVSEIIKKAEAIGLSKSEQKKEYTELLKEITEKYNKPTSDEFVKQEAYTVLKEDLEYIINHL